MFGEKNASGIIHGADIDHFCPDYFGSDKNGICQILKIVKFHLEKQNAFFERNGGNIFDCTIMGIVTFLKRCLSPAYISTMSVRQKKAIRVPG